jgi:catalase-peroxidase
VISKLEGIQAEFNRSAGGGKKVSLADLIVLGGTAAVEKAARAGGFGVKFPFTPGRMDATEAQTESKSFAVLEPKADAFRNYYGEGNYLSPTDMLVEKANLLTLSVPEMTALIGGLRVLEANAGSSRHGVFTDKPGTFSTDFFVNLLDMSTRWQKAGGSADQAGLYEGLDRKTGKSRWSATPVDLIFGSHSELRAIAEVYASQDGRQKFGSDFASAWTKVMMLDRFELRK